MAAKPTPVDKLVRMVWKGGIDLPLGPSERWGACYVVDLDVHIDLMRDGWIVRAHRYTRRPDGSYLMKNHQWRNRNLYIDAAPVMRLERYGQKGAIIEYIASQLRLLAVALFDPKPDNWRNGRRGEKPFGRWGRRKVVKSMRPMRSRGTE